MTTIIRPIAIVLVVWTRAHDYDCWQLGPIYDHKNIPLFVFRFFRVDELIKDEAVVLQ